MLRLSAICEATVWSVSFALKYWFRCKCNVLFTSCKENMTNVLFSIRIHQENDICVTAQNELDYSDVRFGGDGLWHLHSKFFHPFQECFINRSRCPTRHYSGEVHQSGQAGGGAKAGAEELPVLQVMCRGHGNSYLRIVNFASIDFSNWPTLSMYGSISSLEVLNAQL